MLTKYNRVDAYYEFEKRSAITDASDIIWPQRRKPQIRLTKPLSASRLTNSLAQKDALLFLLQLYW